MLSSYNLKNKQTIQISGLILQYCSATTLYLRLGFTTYSLLSVNLSSTQRPRSLHTRHTMNTLALVQNTVDILKIDCELKFLEVT